MGVVKILGFAVVMMILLSILKQYNPSYAVAASLACSIVLFSMAVSILQPVMELLQTLTQFADAEYVSCVLKCVVIAVLMQAVQDLCQESGQTALAGRVELAGKAAILMAAMPLFSDLMRILTELLR